MIIGCTGNYRKEEYYIILEKIHTILKNEDVELFVSSDLDKTSFNVSTEFSIMDFSEIIEKCDFIFAIGGDGTILSTVRRLEGNMKPIMGVHIGGLGFLSECTESNLEDSIKSVVNNEYIISHRMLLKVQIVLKDDTKQTLWALNDIVVDHGSSARVL